MAIFNSYDSLPDGTMYFHSKFIDDHILNYNHNHW